jgi:hypothetical protein
MKLSGTIAPGNSPGQITNASSLTFSSGAIYSWDLASLTTTFAANTFDQIHNNTGGSINLANLTIAPNITASTPGNNSFWDSTHTWVIIDSAGGGTITGTAGVTNNYSSNGTFSSALNGSNLELTWTASAIPEPSTYAAIAGGVMLACAIWRRRRQRQAA